MKSRVGFVSNSSSSSFVVETKYLTEEQKAAILDAHGYITNDPVLSPELIQDPMMDKWSMGSNDRTYHPDGGWIAYPWRVEEKDGALHGFTSMDNFDMRWFMKRIGVDMEKVDMERSG
jgi:hypothetical protein